MPVILGTTPKPPEGLCLSVCVCHGQTLAAVIVHLCHTAEPVPSPFVNVEGILICETCVKVCGIMDNCVLRSSQVLDESSYLAFIPV